jgi:hypothetical protein
MKHIEDRIQFYIVELNSVFHRFWQAKFANGGSIIRLSQLSLLPQLPQKTNHAAKVVKTDSKIII